jgi:cytoskeletal protein RodZ
MGPRRPPTSMSFGSYLRNAREDRNLSLEVIASRTKINRQLLADLEADELRRWPKPQVYRHAFLRSYAQTVGLDPEDVLARFCLDYPNQLGVEYVDQKRMVRAPLLRFPRFLLHGAVVISMAILVFALAGRRTEESGGSSAERFRETPTADDSSVASGAVSLVALPTTEVIPPAEIEGELMVSSNPPDSVVTVNGIGRGKTPVRVRFLPLGSYTIRVIRQNYDIGEQRLMLTAEQPGRTVRFDLKPVKSQD